MAATTDTNCNRLAGRQIVKDRAAFLHTSAHSHTLLLHDDISSQWQFPGPMDDVNFNSTLIGAAPRAWQRAFVGSRHVDGKARRALFGACTASHDMVLQHSPTLKISMMIDSGGSSTPAQQARTLRAVHDALRTRGAQPSVLTLQQANSDEASALMTALETLQPVGQSVTTLNLLVSRLAPLDSAVRSFPNVQRLLLSRDLATTIRSLLTFIGEDSFGVDAAQQDPSPPQQQQLCLPQLSLLPQLRELVLMEELFTASGQLTVQGLEPYLQQLHTLAIKTRRTTNPMGILFTTPTLALRSLDLHWLNDAWVQALVAYAPNLTDVRAAKLDLQLSHAAVVCKWERVAVRFQSSLDMYARLPTSTKGKLIISLEKPTASAASSPFELPATDDLLVAVTKSEDESKTLIERAQRLHFEGVTTITFCPTPAVTDSNPAEQLEAVHRYLPVIANVWQPTCQLRAVNWMLSGKLLQTLLRAAATLDARSVVLKRCTTGLLTSADFTLPEDFPTLSCTSVTLDTLTDDWLGLLLKHAPQLCDVTVTQISLSGDRRASVQCPWQRLRVLRSERLMQLLSLPRPEEGSVVRVECQGGLECPENPEYLTTGLLSSLSGLSLVVEGCVVLPAPQTLSPDLLPGALSAAMNLARGLLPPSSGYVLRRWPLTAQTIKQLTHLPQWTTAQVQAAHGAHKERGTLPGDKAAMELVFQGVDLPEDLELCSLLVESVPQCYTAWRVEVWEVPEAMVQAICGAACTARSAQYPLHLEVASVLDGTMPWLDRVKGSIQARGAQGYVKVTSKSTVTALVANVLQELQL